MADSASPRDGFTCLRPDTGKDNAKRQGESAPLAACGPLREAWCGSSIARPGGVSVNRPSWRTGDEPPASRTARFCTTCRSKPGR